MLNLVSKFFGSSSSRLSKSFTKTIELINKLESDIKSLSNLELKEKTNEFKKRINQGSSIDDLLPEAFAVVREASIRTIKLRHFDVQLIGGIVLHKGMIAEMKTGEGKTLVATLPVYLNSLTGQGVHVITVNDYLAKRDSEWMGQIYKFLGMSVGCITNTMDDIEREKNYNCDVTYGTNSEMTFDYLRDNLKYSIREIVQREHHYAIIDECDSVL